MELKSYSTDRTTKKHLIKSLSNAIMQMRFFALMEKIARQDRTLVRIADFPSFSKILFAGIVVFWGIMLKSEFSLGQTTVFTDAFGTSAGTTYSAAAGAIGTSSTWSMTRQGADWGARIDGGILDLTNDAGATANVAGWVYGYTSLSNFTSPYSTTLSSNPGLITWTFNMRTSRTTALAGFTATTSYGLAMVLVSTSNTPNTTGSGYAVVMGGGTSNNLGLIYFNNGLQGTRTTVIAFGGVTPAALTNYMSVKATYDPSNNSWSLSDRDDGNTAFADPATGSFTSVGTGTNSTGTGTVMNYFGGYWQGSTTAAQTGFFDNVKVTVTTACSAPTISIASTPSNGNICSGNSATLTASCSANCTGIAYVWSPSASLSSSTGATVTASPTTTTVYTITGTNSGSCTSTATYTVTVTQPTLTAGASPSTICSGSSSTLTVSGASTYAWAPSTGLNSTTGSSVTANPTSTTIYTITGTDAGGCSNTISVTLSVITTPTVTAGSSMSPICSGGSSTLTVTGATTYAWAPSTGLSSTTAASVTASPTSTTTYTVTGTTNGCSSAATVTINVNQKPVLTAGASPSTICSPNSSTLTVSGAVTYTWSPAVTFISTDGASVTASPTSTTTFTVTGTDGNSCSNSTTVTLTVSSPPTLTSAALAGGACNGTSATVNLTGLPGNTSFIVSYTIDGTSQTDINGVSSDISGNSNFSTRTLSYPSDNGKEVVVTQLVTTIGGCTGSFTSSAGALTVNPTPSVTAGASLSTICSGSSSMLTADGATSYSWTPPTGLSATTGVSVTASPTSTTTYTVTGTDGNGCQNTATVTVTVNPKPTLATGASPATICIGSSSTLTVSGALTYTWSPSVSFISTDGASVTDSPTSTTTYTITGTDANGCSATASITVTANALPAATASSNTPVCEGSTISLSSGPNGQASYAWTGPNGFTGTGSQTYSQDFNSLASSVTTWTDNSTLSGNNGGWYINGTNYLGVDDGGSSTGGIRSYGTTTSSADRALGSLNTNTSTASGNLGLSYAVKITNVTGSSVSTVTVSYTGKQFKEVSNSNEKLVFEYQIGATSISSGSWTAFTSLDYNSPNSAGSSQNLSATINTGTIPIGGNIWFRWSDANVSGSDDGLAIDNVNITLMTNDGVQNPSIPNAIAANAGTYTVTVTGNNGCSATATTSLIINAAPTASAGSNSPVCLGSNLNLLLTSDGSAFVWSGPNGFTSTLQNPTISNVTTAAAGTYTVTATGANSCTATSTTAVAVNNVIVTATASPTTLCSGGSVTLTANASGGTAPYTYVWNPGGSTTNPATDNPIASTTYTITATDAAGCINTATTAVTVPTAPIVNVNTPAAICIGSAVSLTATKTNGLAPFSYLWSTGATTTSISVTPTANTSYVVTVTDVCNLQGTASTTVTVNDPQVTSSGQTFIPCGIGTATLTASASSGATLNWYSGPSGGIVIGTGSPFTTPSISTTTTYYVAAAINNSTSTVGLAPTSTSCGTIASSSLTDWPLRFNTTAPVTINSVYVIPEVAGTFTVALRNSLSSVDLQTASFTFTGGETGSPKQITLNFIISTPGSYQLTNSVGGVYRISTYTCGYPYNSPSGVFSIVGSATTSTSATNTSTYNSFYSINVTEGCESSRTSVTANVTTAPAVTVSSSSAICVGNSTTISASSISNDPNYTYVWTPGNQTASSISVSPTSTTTYTLSAVDNTNGPNAGCTAIATTTVTVNPLPVINTILATPNPICSGKSVTLFAGTPTSNAVGTQSTTDLNGGPYRGALTANSNRCQWLFTASELSAAGISAGYITSVKFNIPTFSGATGTVPNLAISMKLTNATSVTTNFDNSGLTTVYSVASYSPVQGLNTHTLNGNGFYWDGTSNLLINTCHTNNPSPTTSQNVSMASTTNKTVYFTSSASACSATTGLSTTNRPVITFGVSTASNLTWLWNPGNLSGSTVTASPTTNTTYSVTATDANGCSSSASITVSVNQSPIPIVTNVTNVNCNGGSNGAITVSATSPASPFTFSWSTGQVNNSVTQAQISLLNVGTYSVTVTDLNGCSSTTGTTITQPATLLPNKTVTHISCNGGSNGSIAISPSGGTAPYTYSWSNVATTSSINNLSVNIYSVTVTDSHGCVATTSEQITQPPALVSTASVVNNVSCNGGSNGSVSISASGGTPSYSGTGTFTGLGAGSYSYIVTDANGCTASASFTITQPSAVTASGALVSGTSCNGGSNGSVSITASGGTPPYSGTGTFTALAAGSYFYTVTDGNGCTATTNVTVTQPSSVSATAASNSPVCLGSDINLTATGTGGTGPYSYSWSGPLSFTSTDATPSVIAATSANSGTYSLTVTDANGCTASTSTSVSVYVCSTTLNLQIIIQGYYIGGGQMQPTLLNEIVSGATGAETDTIIVELHNPVSPYATAESVSSILMTDGTASATFSGTIAGNNYYIAIRHRNGIYTWSNSPVSFSDITSYDFTTTATQAYGSNMIQVDFGPDRFAFYNGDINQDENIDLLDFPDLDLGINNGFFGYYAADLNGDGNVDLLDFPVLDANINAGTFSWHP